MACQQTLQEKLGHMQLRSHAHLRDMSNAFASTTNGVRRETVEQLVPRSRLEAETELVEADAELGRRCFFDQRLGASIVELTDDLGDPV